MGRPIQVKTPTDFWANVEIKSSTECWLFKGTLDRDGYGKFWMRPEGLAHRVAYSLHNGVNPKGMDVLHSCDRPACCNPNHLFVGDHSANMKDMWNKNRHPRPIGELNNHAKLTANLVREIRRRYEAGDIQPVLAKEFGVSQANISCIIRRETWKNL